MTCRRRILIGLTVIAAALGIWLWNNRRPIDPRLVGRWPWSDSPGSNYPVIEFRDDGTADHIPWDRGMHRTFLSGVHWWREGNQIVLQYPDRPIKDLHTFTLWLKAKIRRRSSEVPLRSSGSVDQT